MRYPKSWQRTVRVVVIQQQHKLAGAVDETGRRFVLAGTEVILLGCVRHSFFTQHPQVIVRLAHLNFGLISVQDILHNTDLPPARVRRRLAELCRTGDARLKSGTGDDAVYAFGRAATPRAGRAR